nr:SDR family oxidoreductase [Lysinibacillus timonensis]
MKKYALVLGASGSIGSAICKRLAHDGWSLYMHYNSGTEKIHHLLKELTLDYKDQEFIPVQSDFTKENGADILAPQIFSLQSIIFASGHAYYGLVEDTPIAEMDKLWRVHVQNPIHLLAKLSKKLRENSISYCLFIGSIWGEAGSAGEAVYSAVKGAQHAFVKSYAKEVALNHIRVNAIAPGFIDTEMNNHLSTEEKTQIFDEIPLARAGKTQDVANMVAFYVSGQADYVTGQIIRLNGGWYI